MSLLNKVRLHPNELKSREAWARNHKYAWGSAHTNHHVLAIRMMLEGLALYAFAGV